MKSLLLIAMIFAFTFNSQSQMRRPVHAPTARAKQTVRPHHNHSESVDEDSPGALAQSLPVRRVTLYSNGVAYIERRGNVTGHAEISLSFKQSQVDDVLKSMVVLDLGQGRIGAVSYNSSAPPAARLADIPFSIESGTDGDRSGGLAGVLRQLQGARVVVATATRVATGSILTVESRKSQIDANKPAVISYALVIASEAGELTSFDLAEVRSVKLADAGAKRDVSEFANASASARRRDAKTIVVTSDGSGTREMLVSYTIAAPIWKTTYRVVLDQSGKPFFQGWAIVDNVGEEDWSNISLSLVSGTPISFIQPIQKPVYRYRPIVPISSDLRLEPQVYEDSDGAMSSLSGSIRDANGAAIAAASVNIRNEVTGQAFDITTDSQGRYRSPVLAPGNYTVTAFSAGFKRTAVTNIGVSGGLGTNYDLMLAIGNINEAVTINSQDAMRGNNFAQRQLSNIPLNGRSVNGLMAITQGTTSGGAAEFSIGEAVSGSDSGVETAATGGEVGDLFEYKIDQPVTVPHDRSALIPILQTRMDGERVSIYNEATRRDRPMGGMLLKNTSSLTLEDGSMTIIDGDAYAGEALMERLKPGEQRLISFALDLGTLVTARLKEDRTPTFQVRVINGVFQAHYHQTTKKMYTVTNQTDKPRTLVIEHPIRPYWKLTDDTPKPEATTARFYRFRVPLKPHESVDLPVTERREVMDSYALTNFTRPDLELFVARNYIDAQTRVILEKILDIKGQLAAAQTKLSAIQTESTAITEDQERLRENIKALTSTAEAKQLIARYVNKADTQESRLEQLEKDRRSLNEEQAKLQIELDSVVRSFALDRKLTE
jgi:hypothetical protein